MFGRLAQASTMLMLSLTCVKSRKFLTQYGWASREESTETRLQPLLVKQVSPMANGTQRLETLEGVQRRWLQSDGSLCLQRRSCFGNCCLSQQLPVPTLCVCTQLHNPKRKSTSHDIPSVCRAEHSLGRKVLTRFPVLPAYCQFSITLLLDGPAKPQELPFL